MRIAVPKETTHREARVALTPDSVGRLVAKKFAVSVQRGAGAGAHASDADYEAAGARLEPDAGALWRNGDVIVKVRPPSDDEIGQMRFSIVCSAHGRSRSKFWSTIPVSARAVKPRAGARAGRLCTARQWGPRARR